MGKPKSIKNEQILAKSVMLIGEDGKKRGEISIDEARGMAENAGLDLVQVMESDIPVCKIMDLSKTIFKKQKSNNNKKTVKTKEIRFGMNTAPHDLQIKADHASKHLKKGNRLKIVLTKNRRRDLSNEDMDAALDNILGNINENFKKDDKINKNNHMWSIGISP